MKTFHWSSLGAASTMVVMLFGTAWLMPTPSGTSVARASFPTHGYVNENQRDAARDVARAAILYAPDFDAEASNFLDMETASGPEDGGLASAMTGASDWGLDYDLDAVIQGEAGVPRLSLVSLPTDLRTIRETSQRKTIFFKSVLPLVLQVNEQIVQDRVRLWDLHAQLKTGVKLAALDRLWLAVMAARYTTERDDIAALLDHHDVVPPSLALAQAATESAWGTSRFVREGNAMFGEWTFSDSQKGIVPNARITGKSHRVRAFENLSESVLSYVTNLNKHRAYKEYRVMRSKMRAKGKPLNGRVLAGALYRYSERGAAYVSELRSIISGNDLDLLDTARLSRNGTFEPLI